MMMKKWCCILMLVVLLLNSSIMLVISEAVDAIETAIQENEEKVKPLAEINLTKYENFDTTVEDSSSGSKGCVVQFNLKTGIEFAEGEEYTAIKQTNINLDLPWIGDYKPSRVEVITKSTQATNGKCEAVYEYHSSTGILSIKAENSDYTENNVNARDEYEIICIYREECYAKDEEREVLIRANVQEILNDKEETSIVTRAEGKYAVKENINTIISAEYETQDIYDGYITANSINPENNYETKYNEILKIMISNKEIAQKIEVQATSETSLYEQTSIDKNQVLEILGEKGSIEVLDENKNVLKTINKDTETDDNGKISITYENRTQNLILELKNIEKEGYIYINNARIITSAAEITENKIITQINIKGINTITKEIKKEDENAEEEKNTETTEVVKYEHQEQNEVETKPAVSNIEVNLDNDNLVNNTKNNVILTATLRTDDPQYSLFKNPTISIEMPKEVEELVMGTPEIMYDSQIFSIVSANVITNENGNKVIKLQLQGSQTAYEHSSVIEGTNIRIPLTISLTRQMENKVGIINVSYTNEMTATTENKEMEVVLLNKVVNAIQNVYATEIDNTDNNEQNASTTVYEQDGIKVEITEEVGNTTIAESGIVYEQQIIKHNVKVTNNSATSKNINIIANLPSELEYVDLATSQYAYNEEGKYWFKTTAYEYREKEERQININVENLLVGQTYTSFFETRVKDLPTEEQERNFTINYNIQVNKKDSGTIQYQHTVKQAQIKAFVTCMYGTSHNDWDFCIEVVNLSNANYNNVKVAFEASSIFNIEEVTYWDNEAKYDNGFEKNLWTYTIDTLNAGEKKLYYLKGITQGAPENETNTYELNGVAIITGEEIDTYVSNKSRMTGDIEAVELQMTSDKEGQTLKWNDEITYTVTVKNTGRVRKTVAIFTNIDMIDCIPRELEPISATYNKYTINQQYVVDNMGVIQTVQTYEQEEKTIDLTYLVIPEGYDREDAPNINLEYLVLPENETLTMTIKAKVGRIYENTEITNTMTVKGLNINTKTASLTNKVLRYDYDEPEDDPNPPVNPDDPNTPVNPDDPNPPVNPDDPNTPDNPDNPNTPDNPTTQKISIAGVAWADENEDGKRTTDEKTYSDIEVLLYDYKNNTFIKENNQIKRVKTDTNGQYEFDNLEKGQYIVVFLYDTNTYTLSQYQKEGVIDSKNCDAITKTIDINGKIVTAGLTDTLVADKNLSNIDIGLVERKNFDIEIQKYINKITVQANDGTTKTYEYNNKQFAKVEIHSKKINGATVIIEYKMVVTNKGEVPGKVVSIVDKLPDGLQFKSELNKDWYESKNELYTNSLSGQIINAGESKEVTLILTKSVTNNNIGTITNTASIGISNNDKAIEDSDTKNNASNADVIIGVSTGIMKWTGITIAIIAVLVGLGVLTIKNKNKFRKITFVFVLGLCLFGNIGNVLGEASYQTADKVVEFNGSTYNVTVPSPIVFCGGNVESILSNGQYGTQSEAYSIDRVTGERNNEMFGTGECGNNNYTFCTDWHFGVLNELKISTITNNGQWSEDENIIATLTKVDTNNISFNRIDGTYNKLGPFKVSNNKSSIVGNYTINVGKIKDIQGNTYSGANIGDKVNIIDKRMNGNQLEFYIKMKNDIYIVDGVTVTFSSTTQQTNNTIKANVKATYEMEEHEGYHTKCNNKSDFMQPMVMTLTETISKTRNATISGEIKFDTKWTAVGNLEVEKVDEDDTTKKLKNVKITIGNNSSKKLVAKKNNAILEEISATTIDFLNGKVDNTTGYTFSFETSGSTKFKITSNDGKITINNLPCDTYTITETQNDNYGYTKLVSGTTAKKLTVLGTTKLQLKNQKQTGNIEITKTDYVLKNKKLSGVKFVLQSCYKAKEDYKYIIIKNAGGDVLEVTGEVTCSNIGYTTDINKATKFITDSNGKITIKDILISTGDKEITQRIYKFEEIKNPHYGYLADTNKYKNHNITYTDRTDTDNVGWFTVKRKSTAKCTIQNHQEYVRLEGFVWEDIAGGKSNSIDNKYTESNTLEGDALVKGINVYLCKEGEDKPVAVAQTDENGKYKFGSYKENDIYTNEDYLNPENGNLKIEDLNKYYIEFEYDGLKYTSVDPWSNTQDKESKAAEVASGRTDRKDRESVNSDFTTITRYYSKNKDNKDVYSLEYNSKSVGSVGSRGQISTYKDHWGYEYKIENQKKVLEVTLPENDNSDTEDEGYHYEGEVHSVEPDYAVIASTKTTGYNLKDLWKNNGEKTISGANFGIVKRQQPDLAISTDLSSVDIQVNDYVNTYKYDRRAEEGYLDQNPNDENYNAAKDGFGLDVKLSRNTGSYSDRGLNMYTRRIYESDVVMNNNDKKYSSDSLMNIYMTYKITIKNQASGDSLYAKVNELTTFYDERYETKEVWIDNHKNSNIINKINVPSRYWNENMSTSNYKSDRYNFSSINTNDIIIAPNKCIDVYVKVKLQPEAIEALIEKQTMLNYVAEIYSYSSLTGTKEEIKDGNTLKGNQVKNQVWVPYAGIDIDSCPRTKWKMETDEYTSTTKKVQLNGREYTIEDNSIDTSWIEDDTDFAPALVLGIEEGKSTRGLSGTVFEDEDAMHSDDGTHPEEERKGDGILFTGKNYLGNSIVYNGKGTHGKIDKNRISKVKVELIDTSGNVVNLYKLSVNDRGERSYKVEPAVTYTDEKGEYLFTGIIPGAYLIRYTYDNSCKIIDINGNEVGTINVHDYKSTIITSDIIKNALNMKQQILPDKEERMGDLNWILKFDRTNRQYLKNQRLSALIRYSAAVDDIAKREDTEDLYYGSCAENTIMTADTAYFDVGVEYSNVEENKNGFADKISYTDYKDEYELKEDKILVLDQDGKIKTVDTFYAVNPYQDFGITERARQDYTINKRISGLRITLSNGQVLLNGNPYKQLPDVPTNIRDYWSQLEKTSNQPLSYTKALPGQTTIEIDNEILQGAQLNIEYTITVKNEAEMDYKYKTNQDYYYYGTNPTEQNSTIVRKIVDYMDNSLVYDDAQNDALNWKKVTPEELKQWTDTEKDGTEVKKQLISDDVYTKIKQGYTIAMTEEIYNEGQGVGIGRVENVKIYGNKVLSTQETGIAVTNHTEIIEIQGIRTIFGSTPGNYDPTNKNTHEPDDYKTTLTITPPTGVNVNIIIIISITTVALIVLATGIYLIKKKVLG